MNAASKSLERHRKAAERLAERQAKRQAKAEEKAALAVAKAEARERCATLSARVPPEFQQWGSTRTRAWAAAAAKAQRCGAYTSLNKMHAAIAAVERAMTAPVHELMLPA